ncbi:BTB/POZ domain-containing protein [Ditylenchus destructor]|nr:BTB/POZ domain-containing protein [Ditylenchus destructor]
MSENKSTPNSEWVRLNVGGKDKSDAFLIDRSYEFFDKILNYFRSGVLNLDRNEYVMKDLLCEAEFYNVQPLVDEIHKAMGTMSKATGEIKRVEIIIVKKLAQPGTVISTTCYTSINMSEGQDDYEVLQALRQKVEIHKSDRIYYVPNPFETNWPSIEAVLRSYGFVEEFKDPSLDSQCRKFVRSV